MTFPIFLAFHIAYGAMMAFVTERRMRSTGEVLGGPLIFTLTPVALISAPIGALCVRFAGRWFLHGAFLDDGAVVYERFQLGIMVAVALLAALCTVLGFIAAIAPLSRDQRRVALAPFALALIACIVTIIFFHSSLFEVGKDKPLFTHPVLLLNLVIVLAFFIASRVAKRYLSAPTEQ